MALISLFVETGGRGWTDLEISQGHRALERAGVWIEREAIRREVPVNLVLPSTYLRAELPEIGPIAIGFKLEGEGFGPMELGATERYLGMGSLAASRLGFTDLIECVATINGRIDADSHAWLLHLRGAGRSLAIPSDESPLPGIGLAVCYSREASFPEPGRIGGRVDPLTVVHELLHLFGASDKYGVDLGEFTDGSVTRNDVMRMDHESLSRLRVDDLTAREIGWNGNRRARDKKKPPRTRSVRGGDLRDNEG